MAAGDQEGPGARKKQRKCCVVVQMPEDWHYSRRVEPIETWPVCAKEGCNRRVHPNRTARLFKCCGDRHEKQRLAKSREISQFAEPETFGFLRTHRQTPEEFLERVAVRDAWIKRRTELAQQFRGQPIITEAEMTESEHRMWEDQVQKKDLLTDETGYPLPPDKAAKARTVFVRTLRQMRPEFEADTPLVQALRKESNRNNSIG